MFTDSRLEIFASVVRNGSFTAAARELGISQPAVSQNIGELERLAGAPLFERSRNAVTLTEKGKAFQAYCTKILYWYSKTRTELFEGTSAPSEPATVVLEDGRTAQVRSECGELIISFK